MCNSVHKVRRHYTQPQIFKINPFAIAIPLIHKVAAKFYLLPTRYFSLIINPDYFYPDASTRR